MKNLAITLCFLILLIKHVPDTFGQGEGTQEVSNQVIPPSPTAAALGKYGDIPVNMYSGTPQINIPLYTITERDISLNVNMSYHASGIKVDEIASWVGLGWSLNAGGVITRTILGLPDESPNGFRGTNNIGGKVFDYLEGNMTDANELFQLQKNVASGQWDSEPDIYHFNFSGNSGKFVFDKDGNSFLIPKQKVKIIGDGSTNSSFTIIAPDGTRYLFEEEERTSVDNACSDNIETPYTTSWFLTKITSTTGASISFAYTTEFVTYDMSISTTARFLKPPPFSQEICNNVPNSSCLALFNSESKLLSEITTSNEKIRFIPGNRNDILSTSLLDKIEVYDNEDNLIKGFDLEHSYFTTSNERLRLDKITEISETGRLLEPYEFRYTGGVDIPARLSYQQDHWGYFNSNAASTLLPVDIITPAEMPGITSPLVLDGADRSPDPIKMKYCTLEKIIYPLKGYTIFDFEPHDYGFYKTAANNDVEMEESTIELTANNIEVSEENITIDSEQTILLRYRAIALSDGEERLGWYVSLKNIATDQDEFYLDLWDTQDTDMKETYLILSPGNYRLTASSDKLNMGSYISMTYQSVKRDSNNEPIIKKNILAGGLRIKRVIHNDGMENGREIIESYDYRMDDEPDRSSGTLLNMPTYRYSSRSYQKDPTKEFIEYACNFWVRTSNSQAILGMTQGSPVGYREVKKRVGKNNGHTISRYTSPYEYSDVGSGESFPYGQNTSYEFKRGLLKESHTFKVTDERTGVISSSKTIHQLSEQRNKDAIRGVKIGFTSMSSIDNNLHYEFKENQYRYLSEWIYVEGQETVTYDEDFIHPVTVRTDNIFGEKHLQLIKTTTTNSNGEVIITENRYANDFETATDPTIYGSHLLRSAHMHNQVLEQISSISEVPISRSETYYMKPADKEFILPEKQITYQKAESVPGIEGGAQKSIEVDYLYDSNGNLSEVKRKNGRPTAYIWGHKGTLPVAKILNASDKEVAYTSFESEDKGGWSYNIDQVEEKIGDTRTGTKIYKGTMSHAGTDLDVDGRYIVSFWFDGTAPFLDAPGVELLEQRTTDGWDYRVYSIKGGAISISALGGIDEVRLYPEGAQMTSYTYDPLRGMTSATDPSGKSIYYEYDDFGRLMFTRDLNGKVLNKYEYNYRTN